MRIIKFRGKDILTGVWYFGSLFDDGGEEYILPPNISAAETYSAWQVDPNTIGQFAGVVDKNGKEIYEGDIVECVSWNEFFNNPETGDVMEPFRRKMYVDFRNGGFKMIEKLPKPLKDNEWDIIYNGDIKVIGNIYDNPELVSSN